MPPVTFMSWNMLKPSMKKVSQSETYAAIKKGAKMSRVGTGTYAFYQYVAAVVADAGADAFVILEFVKGKGAEAATILEGIRTALGAGQWAAMSLPTDQPGVDPIAIFWRTALLTPIEVPDVDFTGTGYITTSNVAVTANHALLCGPTSFGVDLAASSLPTYQPYPSTSGTTGGKPGFYAYFAVTGATSALVLAGYHAPTPGSIGTPLGGKAYARSYVFQRQPLHGVPTALPDPNPVAGAVMAGGDFNVGWGDATPYPKPPPPTTTTRASVAYGEFQARAMTSRVTTALSSLKDPRAVAPNPPPTAIDVRANSYDHIFVGRAAVTGGDVVDAIAVALPVGAVRAAVAAFATTDANGDVRYQPDPTAPPGTAVAFPPTTIYNSYAFYRTVVSDHLPVATTAVVP